MANSSVSAGGLQVSVADLGLNGCDKSLSTARLTSGATCGREFSIVQVAVDGRISPYFKDEVGASGQ